jgi:choloylglycine hydrolase
MTPMVWTALTLLWFEVVQACTYAEIPDSQGKYVIGRSMEWFPSGPTDWNLATHPVGEWYQMMPDSDLKQWRQVDYGHVSVDLNVPKSSGNNAAFDGLNEVGLSVSANLYKSMKVSSAKASANETQIFFGYIARWVLSSFNSTTAVIAALHNVTAHDVSTGVMADMAGLHFAISDKDGNSIVVEYDGELGLMGKPHIYNNTARTMTNDPGYPWMLVNLDTFSNLSPEKVENRNTDIQVNPSGLEKPFDAIPESVSEGYNLKGLPGDSTPPSRFVRAFYLRKYAAFNAPPASSSCGLALAQALFNSLHIPRGVEGAGPPTALTQWVALKAPHLGQKGTYLIRSYIDMQWRSIDLSEARLDAGSPSMKFRVETDELNVANALGDLNPYTLSGPRNSSNAGEASDDGRRSRRLQGTQCRIAAGLNRSKGFSCKIDDNDPPHFPGNITPRQWMAIVVVLCVACCICGTCVGYLLGRQGKPKFEPSAFAD